MLPSVALGQDNSRCKPRRKEKLLRQLFVLPKSIQVAQGRYAAPSHSTFSEASDSLANTYVLARLPPWSWLMQRSAARPGKGVQTADTYGFELRVPTRRLCATHPSTSRWSWSQNGSMGFPVRCLDCWGNPFSLRKKCTASQSLCLLEATRRTWRSLTGRLPQSNGTVLRRRFQEHSVQLEFGLFEALF